MTIHETIESLRSLMVKVTPAPWRWHRFGSEPILIGDHGMRPIVLGASRKGMQGACITVRNEKLDIMQPLSGDHPDAAMIVASHNAMPDLLSYIRELESVVDEALPFIQHCAECGAYRHSDAAPLIQRIKAMKPTQGVTP